MSKCDLPFPNSHPFICSLLSAAVFPSGVWAVACAKWSCFLSNSIPAALDHLGKSCVNVALTELLSAASEADLGGQEGRFVYICTLKRAIPADHWWCMTQSPSSTGLCSCQISLFTLGNCHRNLTCTAASSCYQNQDKWHLNLNSSLNLEEEIIFRGLMVQWSDKVGWNVYWGSSSTWYIVHVTPKRSRLMKVSHILQLSLSRAAEHCLLTAKSSLTNLVMHQFEKAP